MPPTTNKDMPKIHLKGGEEILWRQVRTNDTDVDFLDKVIDFFQRIFNSYGSLSTDVPAQILLTNQRIIKVKGRDYFGKEIKNIQKISNKFPEIQLQDHGLGMSFKVNGKDEFYTALRILRKTWKEVGPFKHIHTGYQDFAEQHKLKLASDYASEGSYCKMEGRIGKMPFKITLAETNPSQEENRLNGLNTRLDCILRCPNPNNFYFELWLENPLSIMANFVKKDVEIGDPYFDGKFQIKTNNPPLLRELLNPAIRKKLSRLFYSNYHKLTFGKPSKNAPKTKRIIEDDVNVLDLHLLAGTTDEKADTLYNKNRQSILAFGGEFELKLGGMNGKMKLVHEIIEHIGLGIVEDAGSIE